MDINLRQIKASDMGAVCKIITGIGAKKFKDCFVATGVTFTGDKEKDEALIKKIGVNVMFEVACIIVENVPAVQKDLDLFLASLTGLTVKDINDLSLADYGELIMTVIKKDDFSDFFGRVMKSL